MKSILNIPQIRIDCCSQLCLSLVIYESIWKFRNFGFENELSKPWVFFLKTCAVFAQKKNKWMVTNINVIILNVQWFLSSVGRCTLRVVMCSVWSIYRFSLFKRCQYKQKCDTIHEITSRNLKATLTASYVKNPYLMCSLCLCHAFVSRKTWILSCKM